jgi:hypothetical protein
MKSKQIKPEQLKELIRDKTKEFNGLLNLAETMNIPVVVKPANPISTKNKDITGTKSILVITYPAQCNQTNS